MPRKWSHPISPPLSESEIEQILNILAESNPIETNFERKYRENGEHIIRAASIGFTKHTFRSSSQQEIDQYRLKDYPHWLSTCKEALTKYHERINLVERGIHLSLSISNIGTRSAHNLKVSFWARGPIVIVPHDVDSKFKAEIHGGNHGIPIPPVAPQGEWEIDDPLGNFFDSIPPEPVLSSQAFSVQKKTDPERFYYFEKPTGLVDTYSLTCESYRHSENSEKFELVVYPTGELDDLSTRNALVEVVCHAHNMSSSVKISQNITCQFDERSTYEYLMRSLHPLSTL